MKNADKYSNVDCSNLINDDSRILNEVVARYRECRSRRDDSDNPILDDNLSLMACHTICGCLKLNKVIIPFINSVVKHWVLAIETNARYYILDPEYKNFLKGANCKYSNYHSKERFNGLPGFFAIKAKHGKEFVENLVNDGYFECTSENMKIYCDSFALAEINNGKKVNNLVYSTDISGQEYFINLVLDKFGVMVMARNK